MTEELPFTISPDERAQRRQQLLKALQDKVYRDAFARQQVEVHLPFQIKAMRKAQGWNQQKFGEMLGKPQSVVSRLERPDYGRFNINTLLEIASVFDVGVLVTFAPFSKLVDRASDFSVSDVSIPSFKDDPAIKKPKYKTTSNVTPIKPSITTGDKHLEITNETTSQNAELKEFSYSDAVVITTEYSKYGT